MKTATINVTTKVLKTETIFKGKVSEVELEKYYDLDGTLINEGRETLQFPENSDIEIISETGEKYFGSSKEPFEYEDWVVKVNGKKIAKEYEITGYSSRKDIMVLRACTGAG